MLHLDAPSLGEQEKEHLCRCVDENYVSTVGPFVPLFEERFARWLGAPDALSVQSGTAALHMALVAAGIGPGDEVAVPALTFVATVNPVLYVGARPLFVDVRPDTWTIDVDRLRSSLTARTKAVIAVHLYGNPCPWEELEILAHERGLILIEDATESLGATWQGRYTGTLGSYGCFSFNGNKVLTTGGGGMIVAGEQKISRLRFLVNQARNAEKGYFHDEMGYNYRMTNLEASLGLAQLERLDGFLALKQAYARSYGGALGSRPEVSLQQEADGASGSWWMPSLVLSDEAPWNVPSLQARLKAEGIPTRRFFGPLVDYPYLRSYLAHDDYPVARRLYERGLNLPASTLNDPDEVRQKAEQIAVILGEGR